jgi:hypothetical protein
MNDIIVVSILFYISIQTRVCLFSFLPFFSFLRVQKKKKRANRRQGERRKIVPSLRRISFSFSLSLPFRRVKNAKSSRHRYQNNRREKRSKFHRYDASLYNKKVLSADNFFSLSLSLRSLICVLLSPRIEEQKLGERGREKNGFARRRRRKRAHNTYRRDSFHGHGGKHFCFKFLLCALYEERKNSLAV